LGAAEREQLVVGADDVVKLATKAVAAVRLPDARLKRHRRGLAGAAMRIVAHGDGADGFGRRPRLLVEDRVAAGGGGELLPALVAEGAVIGHRPVVVIPAVIIAVTKRE